MRIYVNKLYGPAFNTLWHADKYFKYIVAKGGRSGSKSSVISLRLVYKMLKNDINIVIIRKVGNTLVTSVYEQIKWAINMLDVAHLFKCTVNPLRITHKKSGKAFYFFGADDPTKLKSLKLSNFPITDVWFEEAADHKNETDVTTMEDSIVRGSLPEGLKFTVWYSYNPPKKKSNWINQKFSDLVHLPDTFIHTSTYLDNPWVGADFIAKAEHKKRTNKHFYDWYYGGEPIGNGLQPFNNVVIKDFKVSKNWRVSQGLDFGWTDPLCHARIYLDGHDLYCSNELYKRGFKLDSYYKWVVENNFNDVYTRADNAEARSIDSLRGKGQKIRQADKGKGSIGHGIDWLGGLDNIYIHPSLDNAIREFTGAEWAVDKDGNELSTIDGADHFIDAVRYGSEPFMGRNLKEFFGGK